MRTLALSSVLALAVIGCGGSTESESPKTKLDLDFHDAIADETDTAVPGVKVCVFDRADIPCVTSDDKGQYTLKIPSGEDLVFSYEKPDFFPKLRMVSAEHAKNVHFIWYFQRKTWYQMITAQLAGPMDFGKAVLTPQSTGVAGLIFEIDPKSGDGPAYAESGTGKLQTLLPETTVLGVGAFVNVDDGTYTITFVHPTKICTGAASWAGDAPNSVKMQAIGGHLTYVDLDCK